VTASSGSLGGSPATFFANALFSVKAISSGGGYSCELRMDGAAYCAGVNAEGNFGNGTLIAWDHMTEAGGGILFAALSTGALGAVCGLALNGDAYCWGDGTAGELGNGVFGRSSVPVQVQGTLKFRTISVGGGHVCAIATSGSAYCWGANNDGQLGIGNSGTNSSTPVLVNTTQTFTQISAGEIATCGVTTAGVGLCWGDNTEGEVGDGGTEAAPSPEIVIGNHVWRQITVGISHTCGVTTSNVVYCWGTNVSGLGNGTTQSFSPSAVSSNVAFQQVQTAFNSACALTTGGNVYCWGDNSAGQLGDGTTTVHATPTLIPTGPTFASLGKAAPSAFCAIAKSGGPAWCWGNNQAGALGTGTLGFQSSPARVLNP
jgi:alpha-tubulin suppressor-like RCC1 family protein